MKPRVNPRDIPFPAAGGAYRVASGALVEERAPAPAAKPKAAPKAAPTETPIAAADRRGSPQE